MSKQIEETFMDNISGYSLSRNWFDFCFENPEKINPSHTAIYFFAIEHCNRLGWKRKFGFPTTMVMEAVGIKSYNTYKKVLFELVEFGFIIMIEKSKNQYSSNIIALSNFDKAPNKALDKALTKHTSKQSESTVSINKQVNNRTINNKPPTLEQFEQYAKEKAEAIGLNIDLTKIRAKFYAWEGDGWKTGGKNPRKIKNWKSTLTNSLQYCKADEIKKKPINNYKSMI